MKARIRRISASVDTAISFNSNSSTDGPYPPNSDLNTSSEKSHGYNPSSKSLDINMPESRIERMRKLLSSPLLKRKNPSHHGPNSHVLGQVCPGCLTSAPSNSSSTGSINDTATTNTTTTSSGHFTHHISSSHVDDFSSSMASSMVASPSSGASSSSTTSSTSSAGGPISSQCLIPFVVTRLCNYIETNDGMSHEGLFRISGNAKLVEKLKHCFDITGDAPLETEGDLASAATLLKQFLRELPQPLIPNGLQFLDVIRSLKNDHDTCVLSLKALVSQLPDENYYTLRYLIRFLYRIAQHNDENRMTSSNLGIVFAPNIFRVCVDTYQGLKDQSAANEVVNFLIIEFCDIFNDNGSSGGGGADSSREDLSSTHSYDLECQCSLNLDIAENELAHSASNCETLLHTVEPNNSIDGGETIIPNITFLEEKESDDGDVQPENRSTDESARIELDRKRKDYKSKNHRTIEEFDDDRCQSFDHGSGVQFPIIRPPPQRCNSDGNNEEMTYTMGTETHNQSLTGADELLRKYASNSRTHEIIITNSSDSVSTDDNTTTTATSTGATVCSVVIGGTGSNGAGLGNFPILDRRNEKSSVVVGQQHG
ncbi:Protein fam13a [Blomia tropicalis]|nr:Protein fam13a [Blomia tropicalis]